MASYEDIPCDIIENLILPKLPSKSLLKFMSVSKSWYSLIKTPKFIASHLKNLKRRPNKPLIVSTVRGLGEETYYIFRNSPDPHHIKVSSPFYSYNFVFASYDGIICLANVVGDFMLWNPSINKFKEIPESPILRVPNFIGGFGYNSLEDNYKLVVIRFGDVIQTNNNNQKNACAHVYSLNRQGYGINSGWIEVSVPKLIDDNMSRITTCCFANEMIHWIIFRKDCSMVAAASIMTFDPKTNCFGEIMFPEILNGKVKTGLDLALINNNVVVKEYIADKRTVIVWRMEDSSKSWKPLYNIKLSSPKIKKQCINWEKINLFNPKKFRKQQHQGQVVIASCCSGILIVFCVNSDNSGACDGALVVKEAYTCTESLALLD